MTAPLQLRVHHWLPLVRNVLGPGGRAVVWVQGCSLACKGCMVPETWSKREGELYDPNELARELLMHPEVEGITVSGGEATDQPNAVVQLLKFFKEAGKNTWVYTGYTLEELVARDDLETDRLLSLTDVLVDGRYDILKAGVYRWRGSSNQRIIHLTDVITPTAEEASCSGSVEVTLDGQGRLLVVGVPPPGFLPEFKAKLEARGLRVNNRHTWK